MDHELPPDHASPFHGVAFVDPTDPEVARARASIAARLLGAQQQPTAIGRYVIVERIGSGGMGIVYAAYDPQLDRKVALKLLFRRDAGSGERERLVREAKAMAKLAHPNVVHVYDVGGHDGRIFVAMELVRGSTLRQWARAARRTPREVLAVCMQAGRGLAAAHAAGIVHRDFKPDNVLVGEDGRARVLDFGLARTLDQQGESTAREDRSTIRASARTMTRTGAVLGTPGYIAPEQFGSAAPDVRGDQFSFCATVWETMTGALPYPSELHGDGCAASWQIVAPPRGRMPRWVERVLRRGLAIGERYPRLDDLLRALGRDPALQRLRFAAAGAVLASVTTSFVVGASSHSAIGDDPCSGGAQLIADAWPGPQREAGLEHIARLDQDNAGTSAPRLREQLGSYAERWIDAHREACLAHRRGEHSAELLDRRMTCLDRGRSALGTVGRLMGDADAADVSGIVLAAGTLPEPSSCAELVQLDADLAPVPAEASDLPAGLAEAQTLITAAQGTRAHAVLEPLVVRARELGHPPLLAEALLLSGKAWIEVGDRHAAAAPLREAVDVALRAGAYQLGVEAWGQLAWAIATGESRHHHEFPEGRDLIIALAESRSPSPAAVSLYNNLAAVEHGRGQRDGARLMYERVRAIAPHVPGSERSLAQALVGLAEFEPDPAQRDRMGTEAVELMTRVAGADHPRTLITRRWWALNLEDIQEVATEVASVCADTRRRSHSRSNTVPECERAVAVLTELAGDRATSLAAARRWAETAHTEESRELSAAFLAMREGDDALADRLLGAYIERVAAQPNRSWWSESDLGEAEVARGRVRRALGSPDADEMIARGIARLSGDGRRLSPARTWTLRHARAVAAGEIGRAAPPSKEERP